ncbi:MAG TPA: response regulator, partial [Verrucomicrobiota bacterium]|nr:response regulator [Verrucomicrobiota bacterium]
MRSKILVVDDEPEMVELVELNLRQAGYQVITASDGAEALTKARSDPPDLIVLDLMIPEVGGLDVCRILRREAVTANVPIVMLTAKAAEL